MKSVQKGLGLSISFAMILSPPHLFLNYFLAGLPISALEKLPTNPAMTPSLPHRSMVLRWYFIGRNQIISSSHPQWLSTVWGKNSELPIMLGMPYLLWMVYFTKRAPFLFSTWLFLIQSIGHSYFSYLNTPSHSTFS